MARITEEQAAAVRAELAAGKLSNAAIGRLTGVSKTTVCSIANGEWRPRVVRATRIVEPRTSPIRTDGAVRCAGCGLKVVMPCRKCTVGRIKPILPLEFYDVSPINPDQEGMDEVCGHCGSGPEKITGHGLVCSNCDSPWKPLPSLDKIRERAREELRKRPTLS